MERFRTEPGPRFGIYLSCQARPDLGVSWRQSYGDALELAAAADRLGIDDAWLTEHHGEEDGYSPSPHVIAGAIIGATTKLRVAYGIAIAPLQGHPLRTAEDLAVLDNLSGGRIEAGFGQGYRPAEYRMFGLDFADRTKAFDEALDIYDLAWTGERFDFSGEIYQVVDGVLRPKSACGGALPLWIGAATPRARDRVVRRRTGLVLSPLTDFDHTARQLAAFERACEAEGVANLPRALLRELVLDETDAAAAARARPYLDYVYREQYSPERTGLTYLDEATGERRRFTSSDDPEYLSARFVDERYLVGSAASVTDKIVRYCRELRLDRFVFRPQFPGQPLVDALASLERMAEEVLPRVRAALTG